MTIKTKLTVAFLIISLSSIVVTSIPAYVMAQTALTQQVFNHLESVAAIQEHRVSQFIAQNLERLNLVTSRTQLRLSLASWLRSPAPEHQTRMNRILQDARGGISAFRSISIFSLDGEVIASTEASLIGSRPLREDVLLRGRHERSADTFFLTTEQALGVYLSGPLVLDEQLLGVMVIESNVEDVLLLVSDYSGLGTTGETFLAKQDGNGDALFLTPLRFDSQAALSRRVRRESFEVPITQALLRREALFEDAVDYRGVPVLAATRHIDEADWGLVVKIDQAEALAPVTQIRYLLGVVILVSSLMVIVMSLLVAGMITRPISELTKTARRISDGDLNQTAEIHSQDEVGILAKAFNSMTATLFDDIAKRKEAEEHLALKAEQLERTNTELEEFAYVVSHDLRAPLRAMKSYSLFLQEDCGEQLDEFGLEYVQGISESAQHLDDLVVGLLEYSRIGRIQVELEAVNVNHLLERVIGSLRLDENASLEIPSTLPTVYARRVRLEQIFANLLSNAYKFRRPDVEAKIRITCADEKNMWAFSVHDNGIGMNQKYVGQIFGIFQRLHTQEEYEGTGVGLAIVKKAVSEHGGTLRVQSTLGKGSVFTFSFPKAPRGDER